MKMKSKKMRYCNIYDCANNLGTNDEEVLMFTVPSLSHNQEHRQKWLHYIESHQPLEGSHNCFRLCELHFRPEDILRKKPRKKCLKSDAVPTIFPVRVKRETVEPEEEKPVKAQQYYSPDAPDSPETKYNIADAAQYENPVKDQQYYSPDSPDSSDSPDAPDASDSPDSPDPPETKYDIGDAAQYEEPVIAQQYYSPDEAETKYDNAK